MSDLFAELFDGVRATPPKNPADVPHEIVLEVGDEDNEPEIELICDHADELDCPYRWIASDTGLNSLITDGVVRYTGGFGEWPWYPEHVAVSGRYWIEFWTETYRSHDGTEYDAGVRLAYPEEALEWPPPPSSESSP